MGNEQRYPRTAINDFGTKYRAVSPGAIPEFQHDKGHWLKSQDHFTERHLFADERTHETTPAPDYAALLKSLAAEIKNLLDKSYVNENDLPPYGDAYNTLTAAINVLPAELRGQA